MVPAGAGPLAAHGQARGQGPRWQWGWLGPELGSMVIMGPDCWQHGLSPEMVGSGDGAGWGRAWGWRLWWRWGQAPVSTGQA